MCLSLVITHHDHQVDLYPALTEMNTAGQDCKETAGKYMSFFICLQV